MFYPKEVEDVIDAIPGVAESAVIGLPHADFGEVVTAVVVREDSISGQYVQEEHIIHAAKTKLASFKVPKQVLLVDDLPRNAMGKVQKKALREKYQPK